MPKFRNMRVFSTGLLLLFYVLTPVVAQEKSEARFRTVLFLALLAMGVHLVLNFAR